jgi:nucleotide-binding universal stress UspA family protein
VKLLAPIDGSDTSLRAVDALIAKLAAYRPPVEIHLLNVQHALRKDVGQFVDHDEIRRYHQEEGATALATARARLDAAGIAHAAHVFVGDDPATVIVQFVKEQTIDEVIMGSHGRGELAQILLGSVAREVLRGAGVPVTLVT